MNKILTSAFVSITSMFIAGSALAGGHDSCGDITIAEMDWASAELIANIDKVILDKSNRKKFPSFVILPQAPLNDNWSSRKLTNKKIRQVFPDDASPTNSLSLVMSLLDDLVNDKKINNKRVYLTGLSNGAMGSFELLKHRPNMFASAVLICGGGNPQWAKEFAKSTPLWVAHGSDDDVVFPELSINMVKSIIEQGGSPKFTLYENVNHDSWFNVFRDPDFLNWIFEYSKN